MLRIALTAISSLMLLNAMNATAADNSKNAGGTSKVPTDSTGRPLDPGRVGPEVPGRVYNVTPTKDSQGKLTGTYTATVDGQKVGLRLGNDPDDPKKKVWIRSDTGKAMRDLDLESQKALTAAIQSFIRTQAQQGSSSAPVRQTVVAPADGHGTPGKDPGTGRYAAVTLPEDLKRLDTQAFVATKRDEPVMHKNLEAADGKSKNGKALPGAVVGEIDDAVNKLVYENEAFRQGQEVLDESHANALKTSLYDFYLRQLQVAEAQKLSPENVNRAALQEKLNKVAAIAAQVYPGDLKSRAMLLANVALYYSQLSKVSGGEGKLPTLDEGLDTFFRNMDKLSQKGKMGFLRTINAYSEGFRQKRHEGGTLAEAHAAGVKSRRDFLELRITDAERRKNLCNCDPLVCAN